MKSLLMPWFRDEVGMNSFSTEEHFRRDILVKCFYFQVIAMTLVGLWLCVNNRFWCRSGF